MEQTIQARVLPRPDMMSDCDRETEEKKQGVIVCRQLEDLNV